MISPYKGRFKVSQRYKGSIHKGMDLVGLDSKNIYSTVYGVVEASRLDTNPANPTDTRYGMGYYVRIRADGTGYRHYFAHLSKLIAKVGQRVKPGDLIGVEGNSGHSFGSHLHYEVRQTSNNTTFVDVSKLSGIPNIEGIYIQEEGDDEVIKMITVKINGVEKQVESINKDGYNFVKLRELEDVLNIGYDATKKMPIIDMK